MQIIFKKTEEDKWCLFDTRSEKFFPGGVVRDPQTSVLVEIANDLVKLPSKQIVETANDGAYGDNGYVEAWVCQKYLALNPDIREKVIERLKTKMDRKTQRKPRGRVAKEKPEKIEVKVKKEKPVKPTVSVAPVTDGAVVKRGRGRPKGSKNKK